MNRISSYLTYISLVLCVSCDASSDKDRNGTTNDYPTSGRSIGEPGCSANRIVRASDGNYVLVGTKYYSDPHAPLVTQIDAYAMKIAANGDSLWKRNVGAFDADYGNSVIESPDGQYLLGINTIYTQETSIHYEASAVRTDGAGHELWKSSFFGLWAEFFGSYVQTAADDGYVIGGTSTASGNASYDVTLVKLSSDGDSVWTKTYTGASNEYVTDLLRTGDGGYAILGNAQSLGISGFVLKTDASGNQQWNKSYGFLANGGRMTGEQTADGGFILCATKLVNGYENVYLIRTNSSGDTLWTRNYGGTGSEMASQVRITSDGGFIAAGITTIIGYPANCDAYLIRTDAYGDTLWTRTYGGSLDDYAYSVVETEDRGFIVVGETENFGSGIFFVRTDSLGNPLE